MGKISPSELRETIQDIFEQAKDNNVNFKYSGEDIADAMKIFNRVLNTEQNKQLINSENGQRVLAQKIAEDLSAGKTKEQVELYQSDMIHFTYGDNFLGRGESAQILEALSKNGIPVTVLKGLNPSADINETYNFTINGERKRVKVTQDTIAVNGSVEIISMDISVNGKKIYSYNKDELYYDDEEEDESGIIVIDTTERKFNKENTQRKGVTVRDFKVVDRDNSVASNYRIIETKRGRRIIDSKGRYASSEIQEILGVYK